MRRIAALTAVSVLLLAACGDDSDDNDDNADLDAALDSLELPDQEPDPACVDPAEGDDTAARLDSLTVTGDFGEEPTIEPSGSIDVDELVTEVLIEGSGDPVENGDDVGLHMTVIEAGTCNLVQSSYELTMVPLLPVDEDDEEQAIINSAILGVPTGSRVLAAIPVDELVPEDMSAEEAAAVGATDLIVLFDIFERETVAVDNEPDADLPQVTLYNFGPPDIEVPGGDAPDELTDVVLVEGDGDEVAEGAYVMVDYIGVLWDGGEEFDSSWSHSPPVPAEFPLDGVIPGWSEGLAGQRIGSTVLLVIPSELAYGSEGQGDSIGPDEPLVFVVDILLAEEF